VTCACWNQKNMSKVIGFACAGVAVLCFGSNFVPVKKFETGDGVFFQWILCCAIWFSGMVVNIARGFPQFQPLAILGGFLWCTGNICVIPIIQMIGLGLGMLVWGLTNMLLGWGCGTFGILGVQSQAGSISLPALNYVGVVVCVAALVVYIFVKTDLGEKDYQSLNNDDESQKFVHTGSIEMEPQTTSWVDRLNPAQKRVIGLTLSVLSGALYGVNFNPVQYLIEHGGSPNGLDYVFSHFTGIWITSTFYFLIYCVFKKNNPVLYPKAILPGILSGIVWAIADISWFVANENLLLVISFPIIATGPGVVASIWAIFAFKEIKGRKNILILCGAFALSITGVILIALSKIL